MVEKSRPFFIFFAKNPSFIFFKIYQLISQLNSFNKFLFEKLKITNIKFKILANNFLIIFLVS